MAESIPKNYPQDIHIPRGLTNQSQRGGVRELCQERIQKGRLEDKYGKPILLTSNKSTPLCSPSKPGPGSQHVLLSFSNQQVIYTLKIRNKTKKTPKRMNLNHFNSLALPFSLEQDLMRFLKRQTKTCGWVCGCGCVCVSQDLELQYTRASASPIQGEIHSPGIMTQLGPKKVKMGNINRTTLLHLAER